MTLDITAAVVNEEGAEPELETIELARLVVEFDRFQFRFRTLLVDDCCCDV